MRYLLLAVMLVAMALGIIVCQQPVHDQWKLIPAEYTTIKIEADNLGATVSSYTTKTYRKERVDHGKQPTQGSNGTYLSEAKGERHGESTKDGSNTVR